MRTKFYLGNDKTQSYVVSYYITMCEVVMIWVSGERTSKPLSSIFRVLQGQARTSYGLTIVGHYLSAY